MGFTHTFSVYINILNRISTTKRLSINHSPMHLVTQFSFLMYKSNLNNDYCFIKTQVSFYTYGIEFSNDGGRAYTHAHTLTQSNRLLLISSISLSY